MEKLTNSGRSLVERHADPLLFPPDDLARQTFSLGRQHQREMLGDPDRAADIERRPCLRHVADHARNSAGPAFDRCGLQNATPGRSPMLVHFRKLSLKSEDLIKRSISRTPHSGNVLFSK